ncbi:disease resistance protein RUN1-like [Hibiscus syriacus]|uniref:disease resistance protein RUN1-like n=1 Tax=Hibiscus syriacus TaxID=106335 RepID=UPI00192042B9|nr:disease resistance protein RUN1-like [Hibiscus syriacus]
MADLLANAGLCRQELIKAWWKVGRMVLKNFLFVRCLMLWRFMVWFVAALGFDGFTGVFICNLLSMFVLQALKGKGFGVFFDEEELERGELLSPELSRAIEASRLSIIVFSKDYASSKSCLAELSDVMDRKKTHGQIVLPIFYHVDPSDVRNFGGSFKASFDVHESDRPRDEVKRWKAAFAEAGKLKGWHIAGVQFDRSEAEYINDIVEYALNKLMNSYSGSASEEFIGIDYQKKKILELIKQNRVIGLWGMGGIGKTTLADVVYMEVSNTFESCYFLQNVRGKIEKQGRESVRNEFLAILLKDKEIRIDTPSIGYPYRERLNNLRVIVVLDDVNDPEQVDWMGVKHFGDGSKIILTSRDRQVLNNGGATQIHKVEELNEKYSLQLFSITAFKQLNPSVDFLYLSYEFVRLAHGSPLALKILGAKLYSK